MSISPLVLLSVVLGYFAMLIVISLFTSGDGNSETFFRAGRNSPWYLVAWGMIGASLSGVTFISIPGVVGAGGHNQELSYMQIVLGYQLGYLAIVLVLLPLYYRMGLTSIYGYLAERFGQVSYKTGAAFFILSRVVGSAFRLYLVAIVMDVFVLGPLGFPFWGTVAVTLILIYLYTWRGGIQTVVYTDTVQTAAMLIAVAITIYYLTNSIGGGVADFVSIIDNSGLDQTFFFGGGWTDPNNFWKQFFAGALITIVMTGLDQDMMQKNLTCRNLKDAQKNMISLSLLLIPINLLFLCLGVLLYLFLAQEGLTIEGTPDQVFPTIALTYMPPIVGMAFIIGLIAAAYSSADSALTALTTSFCVDFLGFRENDTRTEKRRTSLRQWVHLGFTGVLFAVILLFWLLNDRSVINSLFTFAGYTYGPLLGLFVFGLFTRWQVRDRWVAIVCVLAALLTALVDIYSAEWFGGLQLGFLNLALNGLLTFLGLALLIRRGRAPGQMVTAGQVGA